MNNRNRLIDAIIEGKEGIQEKKGKKIFVTSIDLYHIISTVKSQSITNLY